MKAEWLRHGPKWSVGELGVRGHKAIIERYGDVMRQSRGAARIQNGNSPSRCSGGLGVVMVSPT
jgi:hypothetical protein